MEQHRQTDINENESPMEEDSDRGEYCKGLDPFEIDPFLSIPSPRRGGWSVSWSDLMMTMFILFVVMYVYQAGSRELEFGPGPGISKVADSGTGRIVGQNIDEFPSDIFIQTRQAVLDEFVDGDARVDLVADKAVRISLAGDLFFDRGNADLKLEARWQLRQIGKILQKNSFVVNVVGHTDDMPNHSELYPTNWELSTARACRVARFLIKDAQLSEKRFFVSGHSWLQPLVPNTTAYNRSLNRRVEIILIKEMPAIQEAQSIPGENNNG
ncbi:MAG: OmpA family protein [Desulfobacterium sp.]|jgi:chemotaxis protein MotB|nr:OmpA family protein [Desulfobacterium sp.]